MTFFFFFLLWQQLKWRPEIDLTDFVLFCFFYKMSKCWDKFTLKCAPAALLLFIDSIIACDAGAVCLFFVCVRACVCKCASAFLTLHFDKRNMQEKVAELNASMPREWERDRKNPKGLRLHVMFWVFIYSVCVHFYLVHLKKHSLSGK